MLDGKVFGNLICFSVNAANYFIKSFLSQFK